MSEQNSGQRDSYVAYQGPTRQTTAMGVGCAVVGALVIGFDLAGGGGVGVVVVAVVIWLLGALIAGMPVLRRGTTRVERGFPRNRAGNGPERPPALAHSQRSCGMGNSVGG